jgi:hypothetical protein
VDDNRTREEKIAARRAAIEQARRATDEAFQEAVEQGKREQAAWEVRHAREQAAAARRRKLGRLTVDQIAEQYPPRMGRGVGVNAYFPSNTPGTCLWCGRVLKPNWLGVEPESDTPNGLGQYADNAFCGLRCGYAFGANFAQLGRRLAPRED